MTMYALTIKRHSGRLQEELILYARALFPPLVDSRKAFSVDNKLSSKITANSPKCYSDLWTVISPKQTAFETFKSHTQIVQPRSDGFNFGENYMFTARSLSSGPLLPYFRPKYSPGDSYSCKVGSLQLPVGFARCVSTGDRDDRESDERQHTTPLADGEGDDHDKENEHILSLKDAGEDMSTDQNKVAEDSSGGEECEDYKAQAQFLKHDQLKSEALSVFCAQKERFKKEFEKRIIDWKSIGVDLATFPYFLSDSTREPLVDSVAAHLRQPAFAEYGSGLPSSSRRIMISGQSGTELYQETLVEAVARDLQASLLVIDSTVLSPHDFGNQESSSESDTEGSGDAQFVGWGGHERKWQEKDARSDKNDEEAEETESEKHSDDETYQVVTSPENAEAIRRKLLEIRGADAAGESNEQEQDDSQIDFSIKKGDRVKYVGCKSDDSVNRTFIGNESGTQSEEASSGRQVLKAGQTGRVVSVPKHMTGKVGVKFDRLDDQPDDKNDNKDDKKPDDSQKAHNLVEWCDLSDLEPDDRPTLAHTEEWFAAIEALYEVASTTERLIIYLPDPRQWFERAVSLEQRQDFLMQIEHKLDQVVGPVVIIAGHTSQEDRDSDDRTRLKTHLEYIRHHLNIGSSARFTLQDLIGTEDIYELFVNNVQILPPQTEDTLRTWNAQLIKHKGISQAKWNLSLLHKILELHNMECSDLNTASLFGIHLTNAKAETVVGWARNHLLASSASTPTTCNGKLMIPRDSLERALTRFRDNDAKKSQPVTKDHKTMAEDEYEKALITAVIPPHEVGVKFDHIGSLENVKQALKELVMLPLQRPELFAKGNLTRPCKGVLLFGPPGTGKTLLAKAVATEAGANFINITGSTITSKWFGDAEKLTKALFSLAKKLSPAVIFVDEVDSLLGARGGSSEHEATRKTRNEFMAAWDGLRSKDNERVLVLAATNRPFDLDDAVIRRLPRRILVDLPTSENRVKILRVILAEEELEPNFDFEKLAQMTEGYSGSDLKNLSIAAAYRPIRELLDAEAKAQAAGASGNEDGLPQFSRGSSTAVIRALRLDDFREGMSQVGASIAYDASSMNELRRWNEQYGEGGNRKKSSFGFIV